MYRVSSIQVENRVPCGREWLPGAGERAGDFRTCLGTRKKCWGWAASGLIDESADLVNGAALGLVERGDDARLEGVARNG